MYHGHVATQHLTVHCSLPRGCSSSEEINKTHHLSEVPNIPGVIIASAVVVNAHPEGEYKCK